MRRREFLKATTILGAAGVPLLARPHLARAAQPFPFSLNWFAVGDHCAYHVAIDKGYYAKAGLDVTLENSKGSGDSLAKAATGRVNVALGEAAAVMSAVARGAPLRIIGMVFDRTPLNVFSRKDLPATTPKDLIGHTIGAPPGDGQRQVWPAFAKANGIGLDQVTWVNVEPTAKPAALAEKRVDFIGDYITGAPLYEKAMGTGNVVSMPWSRFGVDMYSMSFATTEDMIAKQGEQLKGFLQASYQGWSDVMADPEGSLAIFKKRVPEIDLGFIRTNMALGVDLLRTKGYAENGIGWIDPAKMAATTTIVNTYMGLPKPIETASIYTSDFFTKVPMPVAPT